MCQPAIKKSISKLPLEALKRTLNGNGQITRLLMHTTLWYVRIPCNLSSMQLTDALQVISVAATSHNIDYEQFHLTT